MPHAPLDLARVRRQFPGLESDWTLLDNAGGSQVARAVSDRLTDYLLHTNVQLGASYEPSEIAGTRVRAGVEAMADWMGTDDPAEVVLGPSTSMLLRNLAASFGQTLAPGDEVIVTDCDHEANIGPWADLERFGVVVRTWRLDESTWSLRVQDLEPLLSPRTKLVAFTHASNLVGTIHPVREIVDRIHAAGAKVCVDGVAFAPHRQLAVRDWDVDAYVVSLYKVYAPHCAALYVKRDLLESLPRLNHYFLSKEIPYKLQPGSVNYEMAYALTGLWDYVDAVRGGDAEGADGTARSTSTRREQLADFFGAVAEHEESLAEVLLERLRGLGTVRLVGLSSSDREHRVPTLSFFIPGRHSAEIVRALDDERIGIRHGDFYARRLTDRLGITESGGVVRVSAVHYNTAEEMGRAADEIVRALA